MVNFVLYCRLYRSTSVLNGHTGIVQFDEAGDRTSVNYNLINILGNGSEKIVGNFSTFYNTSISDTVRCMQY